MLILSYSYPLYSLATGPIEQHTINVDTDSLTGVDLDYAYAIAIGKYKEIALNFLPGERLEKIRISIGDGLVNFKRDSGEDEMRSLIKSKLGDKFDVVRLKKA